MRKLHRNLGLTAAALVALAALSGCSTMALDREVARSLECVKVAPVSAQTVTYYGHLPSEYDVEEGNGLSDVVVALFKQTELDRKKSKRMKVILDEAGVDVLGHVKECFSHELATSALFPQVVTAGDAAAVFRIEASYGVQSETMSDDIYTPWLELHAILVKNDGTVLWKHHVKVCGTDSGIKPLPFPDPFMDAPLLRTHFDEAITLAVMELAAHLKAE